MAKRVRQIVVSVCPVCEEEFEQPIYKGRGRPQTFCSVDCAVIGAHRSEYAMTLVEIGRERRPSAVRLGDAGESTLKSPRLAAATDTAWAKVQRAHGSAVFDSLDEQGARYYGTARGELMQTALRCPYGQPGDRLWVRETWCWLTGNGRRIVFRADGEDQRGGWDDVPPERRPPLKWNSPIFMPRSASRITLELTEVQVQRLNDITEEAARAEGIQVPISDAGCPPGKVKVLVAASSPYRPWKLGHEFRAEFALEWDTLNAKRGFPWGANPFVWVLAFKRVL